LPPLGSGFGGPSCADRAAYAELVSNAAWEYRQVRAQIYGWENRFPDHEFWRSRAELSSPARA